MKNFILKLSMKWKVLLSPLLALTVISLLGIMFFSGLIKMRSTLNDILNVRQNIYIQSAEINSDFITVHSNIYKLLNLMTSKFSQQQITKITDEQWVLLDSAIEKINSLLKSDLLTYDEKKLYEESLKNAVEYKSKAREALLVAADDIITGTVLMGMCDDQYKILNENLKIIMDTQNKLSASKGKQAKNSLAVFIFLTVFFVLISLFLTGVISIFITRVIVNPIKNTIHILHDISDGEGDLTKSLDVITFDEIGEFARLFNEFVFKIRKVVEKVKDVSVKLASSSDELSSVINNFSGNAQGQAASIEEITATIEEIHANINIIAEGTSEQDESISSLIRKISDLSDIITSMDGKTAESFLLVENMYSEVKSREQSLKYMSSSMISINKSSKEMTNIINIIQDISEKINLLSLNAAIEAARAGNAGRGFAVVADEISQLADLTDRSLKDIGKLIKTSETEINNGMKNVEEIFDTISYVTTGISSISILMNDVKSFMNNQKEVNSDVIGKAKTVGERSEEIKMSINEQKIAMKDIMSSITNIGQLTQENTYEIEGIAANTTSIADMAGSQKKLVDFFKV